MVKKKRKKTPFSYTLSALRRLIEFVWCWACECVGVQDMEWVRTFSNSSLCECFSHLYSVVFHHTNFFVIVRVSCAALTLPHARKTLEWNFPSRLRLNTLGSKILLHIFLFSLCCVSHLPLLFLWFSSWFSYVSEDIWSHFCGVVMKWKVFLLFPSSGLRIFSGRCCN